MFAHVVVLGDVGRDSGFRSAEEDAAEGEPGDVFEHVGVFDGIRGVFAPGEGGVAGDEDAGNGEGVEIVRAEAADDDGAGIADVGFGDFSRR